MSHSFQVDEEPLPISRPESKPELRESSSSNQSKPRDTKPPVTSAVQFGHPENIGMETLAVRQAWTVMITRRRSTSLCMARLVRTSSGVGGVCGLVCLVEKDFFYVLSEDAGDLEG